MSSSHHHTPLELLEWDPSEGSFWRGENKKAFSEDFLSYCRSHIAHYFNTSAFYIVTETFHSLIHTPEEKPGQVCMEPKFFTEKTFIPFIYKIPFMISGEKGINQELTKHGFKLYDTLFDYSFDNLDTFVERNNGIVEQTKKLCAIPLEELTKKMESDDQLQEAIEHNHKMINENRMWFDFIESLKTNIDSRKL